MQNTRTYFIMRKSYRKQSGFCWQPTRNIGFTLGAALRRVVSLREGGPTTNWCRTALYFGRYVGALQRSQGWRGVVIRLKAMATLLQQCAGGHMLEDPRQLGCAISRSRNGIPRVIPVEHRKRILSGDRWTVRIWISFFWLYRVIDIPGKIKLGSITRPFEVNYLIIMEWVRWLVQFLPVFLEVIGRAQDAQVVRTKSRSRLSKSETSSLLRLLGKPLDFVERLTALYLPSTESSVKKDTPRKEWRLLMKPILTELQPRLLTILNSGPNSAKGLDESPGPSTRTSIGSILTDAKLWMDDSAGIADALRGLWPQAAAFSTTLLAQARAVYEQLESFGAAGEYAVFFRKDSSGSWTSDPLPGFSVPWGLGKLGFVPEPAGKIRVVAMVDSLTQMLLRPLHDAVFGILRKIPQDGTFDQLHPAHLLAKALGRPGAVWSYDLSAATDRFPVSLQQGLLGLLIGPKVALQWRRLLTFREFIVPRRISDKQRVPRGTPRVVSYGAGQPMGAYTSWAVFALSHHFLVQFAAFQAGKGLKWYTLYALLGDDVVIGDRDVAKAYLLLLRAIGVEVGLAKSLISEAGVFEFAKRTFRISDEGLLVDISGVSLDAIGAAVTDSSVMEALLVHANARSAREGLRISARILGYGFRTRSALGNQIELMNSRLKGLAVLLTRPSSLWGLTFKDWLLQTTVEVPGILEQSRLGVLMDAVRQRLVSSARKLVDARLGALNDWGYPVESDGSPTTPLPVKVPPFLRVEDPRSPLYEMFLAEWVFKPILSKVRDDLSQLLEDLNLWEQGNTEDGNFSLDEIYLSINRLIDELSAVDIAVNVFIRRTSKENRRNTKSRSSAVRLWKASRKVVSGFLTR